MSLFTVSHTRFQRTLPWLAASFSALLFHLAIPPFNHGLIALVAFVPLLWAASAAGATKAGLLAGWTGFLIQLIGHRWLPETMANFAGTQVWTGVVVAILISGYQAAALAFTVAGARWLALRYSWPLTLTAPVLITTFEAVLPMVSPASLAISVWTLTPLTQIAELGSTPAVAGVVILLNSIALAVLQSRHRPVPGLIPGSLIALVVLGMSMARIHVIERAAKAAPTLRVALIQPNFGVLSRADRSAQGEDLLTVLRAQTESAGQQGAELVIWPESAFPYRFNRNQSEEYADGHPWNLRGGYKGRLLFGSLTGDIADARGVGSDATYNSAVLIRDSGEVAGIYDKRDLLMFGEYIPFARQFPQWAQRTRVATPGFVDITAGPARRVLRDNLPDEETLRIAPMICWEELISSANRRGSTKPNLLVSLSSHAWFGDSILPEYALALASFRAIETRRYLLRATTTGVSSITDATGRTLSRTQNTSGGTEIINAQVPLLETNSFTLSLY
jgi:apolipoprotein N-acyltransferase